MADLKELTAQSWNAGHVIDHLRACGHDVVSYTNGRVDIDGQTATALVEVNAPTLGAALQRIERALKADAAERLRARGPF